MASIPRDRIRREAEIGELVVEDIAVGDQLAAEIALHRGRHRHHIARAVGRDEIGGAMLVDAEAGGPLLRAGRGAASPTALKVRVRANTLGIRDGTIINVGPRVEF